MAVIDWMPWVSFGSNLIGAALLTRFGLPDGFPALGRPDGDSLGLLGLALLVFGLATQMIFASV